MTLDPNSFDIVPEHIAIVMDGNGRWAKQKNRPRIFGHEQGAKALRNIVSTCKDVGVKYLSVYAFSTENWSRPKSEVGFLMGLFKKMLQKEAKPLHQNDVKIKFCGDRSKLDPGFVEEIKAAEHLTKDNQTLQLNLMLNYGSRNEIIRAVGSIADDLESGTIKKSDISDSLFESYLDTAGCPDPDIFIRTSNEKRMSNYMLWQASYAELFFLECMWPEFDDQQLFQVIQEFNQRHRRFGGV